ncbi:MAG: ABC transporter permease [Fimbriimonadaceae bacterium]|nr:ABC transporter permease [Fimbriimonadaceae bacterium]
MNATLTFIGECTIILFRAIGRLFVRPVESNEWVNQMAFVGVNSIPIVALTTMFSGGVLALYSSDMLMRYGAGSLTGSLVGLAVTREVAPVLAGIMVAARCGSSMAAQIGQMAVTEQVDALRSLNVQPINYLVVPRLVACVLGLPILCLIGCYAGILGGLWVSQYAGVPQESFLNSLRQFVQPWDFLGGMIKSLVFGLIVSVVACQQGLRTKDGAVGVGRATTNTVVISMVLIYVANFILAAILF